MPTPTSTALNISDVVTEALAARNDEVKKLVIKKLNVIAERMAYIQTHADTYTKNVNDFNTALVAAASPEAIMGVLEAFKFPKSGTALPAQQ